MLSASQMSRLTIVKDKNPDKIVFGVLDNDNKFSIFVKRKKKKIFKKMKKGYRVFIFF